MGYCGNMCSVNKTLSDTGIGLWHRATTDSTTSPKLMIAILWIAIVILPRKVIKLFCHKDMKVCRWQKLKTNRWTSSLNRQTYPSNPSSLTWLIYFREMQEVVWAVRLKYTPDNKLTGRRWRWSLSLFFLGASDNDDSTSLHRFRC